MTEIQKNRILYIGLIPPEYGGRLRCGMAVQAWDLARQAASNGYDVYISTLTERGSEYMEEGVNVLSLEAGKVRKVLNALRFYFTLSPDQKKSIKFLKWDEKITVLNGAFLLNRHVNTVRPDIVHIHTLSNPLGMSLQLLSLREPVVMSDHGFWQDVNSDHDLLKVKSNVTAADLVISVSRFCQSQQRIFGLNISTPNRVIYNPVSLQFLAPLSDYSGEQIRSRGRTKQTVLFVAGVDIYRKGLDILLKAFSQDPRLKNDTQLVVISRDEGVKIAEEGTREYGLDCRALQLVSQKDLLSYYRDADVLVVPSRSESFGLVYIESLAMGTPVVGFQPTVAEIEDFLDERIGESYDPEKEDVLVLARKIVQVLDTPFDANVLRQKVLERLSWNLLFLDYDREYNSLLK